MTGDEISFNYNENIDIADLNNSKVELRKMSDNTVIASAVSGFGNKLVIVPTVSLAALNGDSVRVVV